MGIPFASGGNIIGRATATAGTVINALIPPHPTMTTRVAQAKITAGATAHTLTVLRPIGTTKASTAAPTGQAVVNVAANPGPSGNALSANDWIAIRHAADNVTRLYQVSSISSLAVTLTANLAVAVTLNDKIWMFGVAADTDPAIGTAHPTYAIGSGATTTLTDDTTGIACGHTKDQPVLLQDNNATNAGSIDIVTYTYTAY